MIHSILSFFSYIGAQILPIIANAADTSTTSQNAFKPISNISRGCYAHGDCTLCDLLDVFSSVAEWVIGFSGSVALLMVVWFGLKLLLPNNASEGIKKAKTGIIASVTGLAVVLGAWTMMNWGLAFLLKPDIAPANQEKYIKPALFKSNNAWYSICEEYRYRNIATNYNIETLGYECNNDGALCGFKKDQNNDCQTGPCVYGVCNIINNNKTTYCTTLSYGKNFTTNGKFNGSNVDVNYDTKFNTWCAYRYGGTCSPIKEIRDGTVIYEDEGTPVIIEGGNTGGICPNGSGCIYPKNQSWSVEKGLDLINRTGGCESIKSPAGCTAWSSECKWEAGKSGATGKCSKSSK